MSQAQPELQSTGTDDAYVRPIDEVGEVARYTVSRGPGYARKSLIEVYLDGDEAASYHIEFGFDRADGEGKYWYEMDSSAYTFADTTTIRESWEQACEYLRIMVDEPASDGSEAVVAVAHGRSN